MKEDIARLYLSRRKEVGLARSQYRGRESNSLAKSSHSIGGGGERKEKKSERYAARLSDYLVSRCHQLVKLGLGNRDKLSVSKERQTC